MEVDFFKKIIYNIVIELKKRKTLKKIFKQFLLSSIHNPIKIPIQFAFTYAEAFGRESKSLIAMD